MATAGVGGAEVCAWGGPLQPRCYCNARTSLTQANTSHKYSLIRWLIDVFPSLFSLRPIAPGEGAIASGPFPAR